MRKIYLWKGYHSQSLKDLLKVSWEKEDLFIVCPPYLQNIDFFIPFLPSGNIQFLGNWRPGLQPFFHESKYDHYPQNPLFGIFTTGTERARPRLVLYSEKNIIHSLNGIYSFFCAEDIKTVFCYPQPFHVFGLILGYLGSILKNKELIFEEGDFSPIAHQHWLDITPEKRQGLLTLGTPTHFKDLIYYTQKTFRSPAPSLTSIAGGAQVEIQLWNQIQSNLKITHPTIGYGCTEASLGVTHLPPGMPPTFEGVIGFALPGIELEVIEEEGVLIKGNSVCLAIIEDNKISWPTEYLIKDSITKDAKTGLYSYQGRNYNILNRGGEKFYLEQIELFIKDKTHLEIVCLPVAHPRLGEELGILIQSLPSMGNDQKDHLLENIYDKLKKHYQKNFNPQYAFFIEKLPLNANIKIDRKACQRIFNLCLH